MDEFFLYHYFDSDYLPFMTLTSLPLEEARRILFAKKASGKIVNPDIEGFLSKRYGRDSRLRDAFLARGGRVNRISPVYMTLGEHRQWESAYENPEVLRIPLEEFDPMTVSFTYGDSFAVFNPALFDGSEYWNKVYFADEIFDVIERNGFPPYVEYDFKRSVYPKDKHINDHLKYVEAHIWSDEVLTKYREKWTVQKGRR